MSDFIRLPVGEGPIRIKFDSAEWSPQKNKLILKAPLQWYVEGDAQNGNEETDGIVMLDAHAVTEPITNPMRISLDWGAERGNPPVARMFAPPADAVAVVPGVSQGSGGGEKTYKPWTPRELEDCYTYWETFMSAKYEDQQARAYAIDGMVEISSMACKPSDFTGAASPPPQRHEPPNENYGEPDGSGMSDEDVPFDSQAPIGGVL